MADRVKKTVVLAGCFAFSLSLALAQSQRDVFSRWRPTHELAGVRYVGSAACAQCHAALGAKRLSNPMSRALEPVENCDVLKTHPRLGFRNGAYNYQIVREGSRSSYIISQGPNSISE